MDRARLPKNDKIYEQSSYVSLTGREKQVLRRLKSGVPYKQIADELSISIKTVEFHASKIFRKMQISNRYELSDQDL